MKRMKLPIYKQFYVKSILARLFGTPSSSGLWAHSKYESQLALIVKITSRMFQGLVDVGISPPSVPTLFQHLLTRSQMDYACNRGVDWK